MTRKLLTAIDQITSRTMITHQEVSRRAVEWVTAHQVSLRITSEMIRKEMERTLTVERLVTTTAHAHLRPLIPLIPPQESTRYITRLLMATEQEEKAQTKHIVPSRFIERLRRERLEELRPEQIREQMRQYLLDPTAISLIDHTAFCSLEAYLWQTRPLQVTQVLGELLKTVTRKTWYVDHIVGLESLTKLMMQMYLYAFMEFPMCLNILGLRVTPLTMLVLRHKVASVYMTHAMECQDVRTRPYLGTVQARKIETKLVVSERSRTEVIPRKENIAVTTDLTEDTRVSTGRDGQWKDMFFTMLRYAYSMPFWLRRWLARTYGMPENHKYARYFGIGCIPTRYARYSRKERFMPEATYLTYSRDEKIMKEIIRYNMRFRGGVTYKGRYGGWRFWRRRRRRYYT